MIYLIVWTDETGPRDTTYYWCGLGSGYDGQGWLDDRREAKEMVDRDEAAAELKIAWDSLPGAWFRAHLEVQEIEVTPEASRVGMIQV